MASPEDPKFSADQEFASKLLALDRHLATLSAIQAELDEAGFALASIHLNDAIERLHGERVQLAVRR